MEYVGDNLNQVDVEAKTKADKQHRKVQNRKNQRAHRESFPQCLHPLLNLCALKDWDLESKTQGLFKLRARSWSGAGVSTKLMIVPPKMPRQY